MISAILESLVPELEAQGFKRVDFELQNGESATSGSEVVLERSVGDLIDSVAFNFDKYRRPSFQVHISRREADPPNKFIRAANLVTKSSDYYHLWGKPWWFPTRFWSPMFMTRAIDAVRGNLGQAIRFLDIGEVGPNISKGAHERRAAHDA